MSDEVRRQFDRAVELFSRGDYGAAEQLAASLAEDQRTAPDVWNLLAVIRNRLGNLEGAIAAMEWAIRILPTQPIYHANLAEMYRRRGDTATAVRCARRAIELNPNFGGAYCNLGSALKALGEHAEAEQCYQRALELNPQDHQSCLYLGYLYWETGKLAEAASAFHLGWRLAPERLDLAYSLAQTHFDLKNDYYAEFYFKDLLSRAPDHALSLKSLAVLLQNQGRFEEGLHFHRRYLDATATTPEADAPKRLHLEMTAPIFSLTRQEIDRTRERLTERIGVYERAGIKADLRALIEENLQVPSQLIYHGRDNRTLKERYARLFASSFAQQEPHLNTGKIRLGFFVTRGHEGVFAKYMCGLINGLDPTRFESWIVCERPGYERWIEPRLTQPAVRAHWIPPPQAFETTAAGIRDLQLDILYHWEIGTDGANYFMPFLRLAPVQVTSVGWPDTSGIPTVDYFISSRWTEPEDAERHYSERLVRLDRLPLYLERPSLLEAPSTLESLGVERQGRRVYFCGQNLRKLHPDQDDLIGAILRRDPQGLAVFVQHESPAITEHFRLRLSITQADVAERIAIVRRLSHQEYLSLLHHADVVLDSVHFGGASTAYDAFAMHRPVVTLPGTHARGRYTAGCYAAMGIEGCVAADPDSYVAIAVRLAADQGFRASLIVQLEARSPRLFGDAGLIDEYQSFFERVARS